VSTSKDEICSQTADTAHSICVKFVHRTYTKKFVQLLPWKKRPIKTKYG